MSANLLDEQHTILVADQNDEAVIVAADVEDNTITREEVSRAVTILNFLGCFPFGILSLIEPRDQRRPSISMFTDELFDECSASDGHVIDTVLFFVRSSKD